MKKLIIIIMLISALLLSTSCGIIPLPNPDAPGEPGINPDGSIDYVDMTGNDYAKIEELYALVGNKVDISVKTESLGVTLNATYAIGGDTVTYSVETLNMLPSDGNIENLPESMISTITGAAHINENGELVDDGDGTVALPEGTTVAGVMDFSEGNFKDGKRSPYGFEGEVASVKDFLGADVDVDSMYAKVDYTDAAISSITLTYTRGNATVTITYTF